MAIGDILFVASVFLLFVIFAFGVASLQLGCYACYRRRALATSSRRGRWRRGGGGGTGWHPDLAGLRPGAAPRSLPAATVYRAAAPGPKEERAVCLAELEDGEQARFLPCCGHEFHAECVDVWLASRSTCPPLCGIDVARPPHPAPAPASALPRPVPPPEPASYAAPTCPGELCPTIAW